MNLPERLAREIARVAVIRERYSRTEVELARATKASGSRYAVRVNMQPAIALMGYELDHAFAAIGEGNVSHQLKALEALQEFKE